MRDPTLFLTVILLGTVFAVACRPAADPERDLQSLIDRAFEGDELIRCVALHVDSPALGLDSTWWEILEPKPAGVPERAHQFLGDLDITDSHPYYDLYGEGGIASTVTDMASFFRALFTGSVYSEAGTIDTMLTTIE